MKWVFPIRRLSWRSHALLMLTELSLFSFTVSFFVLLCIVMIYIIHVMRVTPVLGKQEITLTGDKLEWSPFQFITSIDGGRLEPKSVLLRRGLLAWSKHGHMCLAAPDFEPAFDITVCMDVARNPGPDIETPKPLLPTVNLSEPPSLPEHVCGTQDQLYSSCVVLPKPHSELSF